jgi:uncharacterized damage-inducible protein DinB
MKRAVLSRASPNCSWTRNAGPESPTIGLYSEALWAELPDARVGAIEPSLRLSEALHQRWVQAWRALEEPDWLRTFYDPTRGAVSLEEIASLYAWHGRHHVAQVRALRLERRGIATEQRT